MYAYCVILVTVSVKVFCIITCEYLTNAWNAKTTSYGVAQLLHMWQKKNFYSILNQDVVSFLVWIIVVDIFPYCPGYLNWLTCNSMQDAIILAIKK